METKYRIKILSNAEFDKLPYKHAKDALGCADKATGTAYIRDTQCKELNETTMEHELQELLATVSPHEVDGIRYKRVMDIIKPVITVLSWIPQLAWLKPIAIAMNAIDTGVQIADRGFRPTDVLSILPAVSKVAGAVGNTFSSAASPVAMAGSNAADVASGLDSVGSIGEVTGDFGKGIAAFDTAAGAAGNASSAAGGLSNSFLPSALESISGAADSASALGSFATDAASITRPGISSALQGALNTPPTPSFVDNVKDALGGQVKSLAAGAVLNTLAPGARTPTSAGSEGALARFAPNTNVNFSSGEYSPAVSQEDLESGYDRISQNTFQRTRDIFDQFRSTSPGVTPEGNTAFAGALNSVNQSQAAEKDAFLNESTAANQNKDLQYQYKQLQSLNSLDDNRMKFYVGLAGQGDDEIRKHVGNDVGTFKSAFSPLTGIKWN